MLFSLGAALLILLVTASLALRKGLYRATVLFFACLFGAVVAFAYYENIVALLNREFLQQFGEGIVLILLFAITALALDLVSERLLTGRMKLPTLIDRIGAGFVGFWTAMIAVGVLCVAIQMLPWDRNVFGFERIYRDKKHNERTRSLLLSPDGFAVSLVGYLSDNALGASGRSFRAAHPDLLEELARSNLRVQAESRRVVLPAVEGADTFDVLTVVEMEDPKLGWARSTKGKSQGVQRSERGPTNKVEINVTDATREPAEGNRYLVARCKLSRGAAHPEDRYHRFTPQQVRMVGMLNHRPKQYYLRGYREPSQMSALGLVSAEQPILFKSRGNELTFDMIFEVPIDFQPTFVEYKRLARGEVREGKFPTKTAEGIVAGLKYVEPLDTSKFRTPDGKALDMLRKRGLKGKAPAKPSKKRPTKRTPKRPPAKKPPAKPTPKKPTANAAKGRVGGRLVQEAKFDTKLPFRLSKTELSGQNARVSGGSFSAGHVYVSAANARGDPSKLVTAFAVPRNVRLLQLKCSALHAKSLFGKAKSAAVKGVGQYAVIDSRKKPYLPIGEYRIAAIGGKRMLELQYDAEGMPGRAIRPASHIRENQLQSGTTIALLYHIPPGTKLVEFSAGPAALSKSALNVTAPR